MAQAVAVGRAAVRVRLPGLEAACAGLGTRIARDGAAEMASGRLALWLPVLFAAGVLLYFGAAHEPSLAVALTVCGALTAAAALARARPVAFPVLVAVGALAAGFAAGCVRTALLARPMVEPPPGPVRLTGYVERLEHRASADRILLRVVAAEGRGLATPPRLVRLSLRKGTGPEVGAPVRLTARLMPPLAPAMPGAHDFGRGPWFAGIDAVGFALGAPKVAEIAAPPPFSVRFAALVDAARAALGARIRASIDGTPADIAVALVSGDRTAIDARVEESMRTSGLTHILSISGLHMAMVAGTLFALVRGLLAAVPALALGFPVKSTAAAVALAGSAAYLVLSGNDVPAQRSFIMMALVLAGVLVGRPALTLRTVALAALIVLALTPETLLEPGTQMSFAATLALVAAYERLRPLRGTPLPDALAPRLAVKGALFVAGIAFTALVAGLASAPFGALHFQRLAPYGVLANVAAMPAVSLLVMPFGLLGVLLMPFGWDGLAWPVMGRGIEIMVAVSDFVAGLPGADARTDRIGPAAALCAALALFTLTLSRGVFVALAAVPLAVVLLVARPPERADVLIAANGRTVGVRGPDGRLNIVDAKAGRIFAEQWLGREGDRRLADAPDLQALFACDRLGCAAPLADGRVLAVSRKAEGLEADCLHAAVVVAASDDVPARCPARVIRLSDLARTGTLALMWDGRSWREVSTRRADVQRPWMPPLAAATPEADIARRDADARAGARADAGAPPDEDGEDADAAADEQQAERPAAGGNGVRGIRKERAAPEPRDTRERDGSARSKPDRDKAARSKPQRPGTEPGARERVKPETGPSNPERSGQDRERPGLIPPP